MKGFRGLFVLLQTKIQPIGTYDIPITSVQLQFNLQLSCVHPHSHRRFWCRKSVFRFLFCSRSSGNCMYYLINIIKIPALSGQMRLKWVSWAISRVG